MLKRNAPSGVVVQDLASMVAGQDERPGPG
jgi:hypothetical protein